MSEDSLVIIVWAHCTPRRTGCAAFRWPVALRPAILAIMVSCFFCVVLTVAGVGGIRGIWDLRKRRAVWDVIERRPGGSHVTGLTAVWGVCHRLCALAVALHSQLLTETNTHSNSYKNHYHCKSHSTGKKNISIQNTNMFKLFIFKSCMSVNRVRNYYFKSA